MQILARKAWSHVSFGSHQDEGGRGEGGGYNTQEGHVKLVMDG